MANLVFVVTALRPIPQDEEITISYFDRSQTSSFGYTPNVRHTIDWQLLADSRPTPRPLKDVLQQVFIQTRTVIPIDDDDDDQLLGFASSSTSSSSSSNQSRSAALCPAHRCFLRRISTSTYNGSTQVHWVAAALAPHSQLYINTVAAPMLHLFSLLGDSYFKHSLSSMKIKQK